ncbi:sulfite exporter TauE/SafE family protein [Paucibacter sp. PLA-PC-4]|uniref:sulfite exporter TauE/SafE family protein n=1 Tax=Paucibacter sp. PLA-PC-4 TaxID=2993655 RepID=UPI0022491C6F|nr:sulfite exporter TauE/SafE family protein [Paucibacter sp. PLA-PC-4]MCX2861037.1 sulfite exporter TauE/SafE family protein [Paucibacter sp. PLA-PC-4]
MEAQWFVIVVGAVVAGFVQGLSGFGFSLTAMSFWAWSLEPMLAASLAVFGSLTGQIVAAVTMRRGFEWRALLPFLLGGAAGIPIGVAILPVLDVPWFKAGLGLFLVLWCPAMLASARLPHIRHGGRMADGIAGALGGVMGGIGGFTGTIPTLWCTLRGFAKDKQRAIIQNFNLAALSVTMAIYLGQGFVTREMLPMFAVVAPALLLPSLLGARLYRSISETAFRRLVLSLLTLSGLALLASAVPQLLQRL